MKKILAVMMAVVMMMAIAVPAFANTQYEDKTAGTTTIVKVDGTNNGTYEGSYTVTIPASVTLTWGQNGSDVYKITSQLATDKRVQVTLANTKDLTAGENVIPFTVANAVENDMSKAEVVTDETHTFNITVVADEWLDVPYDAYEGQITFTANIVDVNA